MRFIFFFSILVAFRISAQEQLLFQKPSSPILQLADYERPPSISMDSKKTMVLFSYRDTYKTLQDLNQEELRLGGLRVNPILNISSTQSYVTNLKLRPLSDVKAEPEQIKNLPKKPKITYVSWSPTDEFIAFVNMDDQGLSLWVIEVATKQAKQLSGIQLNANTGMPYNWAKDGKSLLVRTVPLNRAPLIDSKKDLPKGPTVSVAEGKVSQNRTYQDLLKNPSDEKNFEILVACELKIVKLNGEVSSFLPTDLFIGTSFSPDGLYVLATTLQRPFSYIVPYSRFPMSQKVYDLTGKLVKEVNAVPLVEIMPKGFAAVRTGKRNMMWRSDAPNSLMFVEALDGGDPAKSVDLRDELFSWEAPFTNEPKSLLKVKQRFSDVYFSDQSFMIVRDSWYDTRSEKTYLLNLSDNSFKIISDRNYQDAYGDPGSFQQIKGKYGIDVLTVNNNKLTLFGDGFTKDGQFPFIDEFDWTTLKTKRIYTANFPDKKIDLIDVFDEKKGLYLVQLQSKSDYPNYYLLSIKNNKTTQLTFSKNPFESIKTVEKQVIKYKRNDGVELSGTLYLPVGYDKTKKPKVPLLIWAYPEEFKDKNSAGQNKQNPNEFTFPNYGSFVYWVTKGYAVLDDASFPIIGEGNEEPNNTFIEQLVANGRAAIDAVDSLGYIDRKKVAVGGHSYGAFMTANLLTHSEDFACGIARSGAYNRTLTPFGFQSEQRNFWDVAQIYGNMSPFFTANKMDKPILLIHGEADNNPGTFTLQTERYFQAIKGLGGNARMVILPKESHGYAAKENILHVLWEQEQFLDKYLK
ncbi:MAG: prolyl oligopeptidase family serine peptidase [Bacteroidetes bacterium]|nr:prolyl oligopeptidase family serine peptidase [Bacteroidota bacterium]